MRRSTAILVVILLLLAPLLVLLGMRLATDELEVLNPPIEPVIAMPEEVIQTGEQLAVAHLTWSTPQEIGSPNWNGLVTEVHVTPPESLETGTKVLTIDGVTRVAAATDRPFMTSLARGDAGSDVLMLQQMLSTLGYLENPPDGRFGQSTHGAVKAFALDLGVGEPTGEFDPGWLIWIPAEGFRAQSMEARVSFPAPTPGSLLLTGTPHLVAIRLLNDTGQPLDIEGEWDLLTGDHQLHLSTGVPSTEELQMFGSHLEIGEAELRITVRRSNPLRSLSVPPTAILVGEEGNLCVYVADADGFEQRDISVDAGAAGATYIRSGISEKDRILVNPAHIFESPSCH